MMRTIGAVLLLLGAAYICRLYAAYSRHRLADGERFVRFLTFVKRELTCFSRPFSEWKHDFPAEDSSDADFAAALAASADMSEFCRYLRGMSLSPALLRVSDTLSHTFGRDYRDGEILLIDTCLSEAASAVASERESAPRSERVVRTVTLSAAVGLLLLFW